MYFSWTLSIGIWSWSLICFKNSLFHSFWGKTHVLCWWHPLLHLKNELVFDVCLKLILLIFNMIRPSCCIWCPIMYMWTLTSTYIFMSLPHTLLSLAVAYDYCNNFNKYFLSHILNGFLNKTNWYYISVWALNTIENDDIKLKQRWSKLTLRKLSLLSLHPERVRDKHLNKEFCPQSEKKEPRLCYHCKNVKKWFFFSIWC